MSTQVARAREPFRFVDYEGLVVASGVEARNLRELVRYRFLLTRHLRDWLTLLLLMTSRAPSAS